MLANVPRYLRQFASWWRVLGIAIAGAIVALPAAAAELDDLPSPSAVAVHAFVSQGYIKSTGNDYLVASKGAGSFDFSEAGINFTAQLTEKFRVGIQLLRTSWGSSVSTPPRRIGTTSTIIFATRSEFGPAD